MTSPSYLSAHHMMRILGAENRRDLDRAVADLLNECGVPPRVPGDPLYVLEPVMRRHSPDAARYLNMAIERERDLA